MRLAASYLELEVYKESRKLAREMFEITKRFPKEEMYALTDQALDEREHAYFVDWCKRIGGMLGSMMAKAETFRIHA